MEVEVRAAEMTGAEVDRWLASRALHLGVGQDGRVYIVSLCEWGVAPAMCRASGATFSEALGHAMACWERENSSPSPGCAS